MNVSNEYGTLKKVIVGTPYKARIPFLDRSLRVINYADKTDLELEDLPTDCFYPEIVIEETLEDVSNFVAFLESGGIQVIRPKIDHDPGYYYYCPRDTVLSYKDYLIATPQPIRARRHEYKSIFDNIEATQGKKCIDLSRDFSDDSYNLRCLGNRDILALHEHTPSFDAANCLKHHDNIFYLVSNSGNNSGGDLLQHTLGPTVTVHKIRDVYSYMHIDSTLAILRDGLLLVNPSRIKSKDQLPKYFSNWELIESPYPNDIGHFPGYCNSSSWVFNVNLLSIDSQTVIIEKNQKDLIKKLKQYKIDAIPMQLRHARTLGGGWHCITLDLERLDV